MVVAKRTPKATSNPPTTLLRYWRYVGLRRTRLLTVEENQARQRHQIVLVMTKEMPSIRNAIGLDWLSAEMNCGRNARKKRATLGLSALVIKPCLNAAEKLELLNDVDIDASVARLRSMRQPRKIR